MTMQAKFGPQWREIMAVLNRAGSLTDKEAQRLDFYRQKMWPHDISACLAIPVLQAKRHPQFRDSWDACLPFGSLTIELSRVVNALCLRDYVGQFGFTQEHYDTLTGPWRLAVGPIHADDEAPEASHV